MSAALVSCMFQPMIHDYRDDLESSLWVLVWLFLMYSPCSDQEQATLFLKDTLDGSITNDKGSFNKADWLKGGTFPQKVTFDNRPALDQLVSDLVHLFACRYEQPLTSQELEAVNRLQQMLQIDPKGFEAMMLDDHKPLRIARGLKSLENHEATINMYTKALTAQEWGSADPAQKQNLRPNELSPTQKTKSDWVTTVIFDSAEHGASRRMSVDGSYESSPTQKMKSDCSATVILDSAEHVDGSCSDPSEGSHSDLSDVEIILKADLDSSEGSTYGDQTVAGSP